MFHIIKRSYSDSLSIKQLLSRNKAQQNVEIQGWIKAVRKMKSNTFVDVNDGTTDQKLQVTLNSNAREHDNLTTGSSIRAFGNLQITPKGQLELQANNINIIRKLNLEDGYPFAPRKIYPEVYTRQFLHLRPRTNKFAHTLRVRDKAMMAIHEFLHEQEYIHINTPILTSNDCEGAGEVFTIRPENVTLIKSMKRKHHSDFEAYFDGRVFLTVSGQLHLEAVAQGLNKVYTFGPTFRAENSRSRLHLSEFYMLEVETCFISELKHLMKNIESLVKSVTNKVASKFTLANDLKWIDKSFPVLSYDEAINILKSKIPDFNPFHGIGKEDEIFLVKHCGDIPTFIINWPKVGKPFYMKECIIDKSKVAALDLLAPNVGEIAGGSLREDDYVKLQARIPNDKLQWYVDLRKFGGAPSAGYGLGFERYLLFILGENSIKDVLPFPRWPHNCDL